jgi:uncharacterized protein CbrC (UPF0167 family)
VPNKIDPEPYFFRWSSCIPIGSKDQPELVGQPCYQHKTCKHLVLIQPSRIPPKICPWCEKDTVLEAKQEEHFQKSGAILLEAPQIPAYLKPETFKFDK